MNKRNRDIKELFDFLQQYPETQEYQFECVEEGHPDGGIFVLYHSDGHRVDIRKDHVIDVTEPHFSWKDWPMLDRERIDKKGYIYNYRSWDEDDMFVYISLNNLIKKIGVR